VARAVKPDVSRVVSTFLGWQDSRATLSPNSEANLGEVAFPLRSTIKRQVVYQGTASAVPERDEPDGLQMEAPGKRAGAIKGKNILDSPDCFGYY
jgi:hypothetical protein